MQATKHQIKMCTPSASAFYHLEIVTQGSTHWIFPSWPWLWLRDGIQLDRSELGLLKLDERQHCLPPVNILIDTGLFLLSQAAVNLASNHTFMHLPDHQIIWFCKVVPWCVPRMPLMSDPELAFYVTKILIYKILFIKFLWIFWMLFDVKCCSIMYFCNDM